MRLKQLATLFAFTFILLVSIQAKAADINDQGAARLKTMFETILADQARMTNAKGDASFQQQGEVIVEQADSYYAVTMPFIQIAYDDGRTLKLGIISINAVPHEKPGQWKITLALPTPMSIYGEDDTLLSSIAIGGQQAAGIFHEDVRQFSKLDSKYSDIKITSPQSGAQGSIGNIITRFDFNAAEDGTWSGPGYVEFNNLNTTDKTRTKTSSIQSLKGSFSMDKWNPQAGIEYQKRYLALEQKGAFKDKKISETNAKELSNALFDMFTKGMNGFESKFSVSGASFKRPVSLKNTTEEFKIDEASITLGMNGFFTDALMAHMNMGYNGFHLSTMSEDDKEILPAKLNFDVKIKNIPFKQISEMGQNTVAAAANNPGQAMQLMGITALMKLPAILSQAGTTVEFKDNMLGNDLYNVDLNGEIKAEVTATNSAVANATMVFKGLNALLSKTRAIALNPQNDKSEEMEQLSNKLEVLQSIGASSDAGATHTFEFIMNPQGEMLLNGKDVRTMDFKGTKQP